MAKRVKCALRTREVEANGPVVEGRACSRGEAERSRASPECSPTPMRAVELSRRRVRGLVQGDQRQDEHTSHCVR